MIEELVDYIFEPVDIDESIHNTNSLSPVCAIENTTRKCCGR